MVLCVVYREVLLVAENREERRKWMEKLQEQNQALMEDKSSKNGSTLEVCMHDYQQ